MEHARPAVRPPESVIRQLEKHARKGLPSRDVGGHERPRAEWIEVPVPALVSEEMFALAQEQLEKNKHHSPRRTPTTKGTDFAVIGQSGKIIWMGSYGTRSFGCWKIRGLRQQHRSPKCGY